MTEEHIPSPPKLTRSPAVSIAERMRAMSPVNGLNQWEIFNRLPISDERREELMEKFNRLEGERQKEYKLYLSETKQHDASNQEEKKTSGGEEKNADNSGE